VNKLIGIEYFKERLSDVYKYSLIPYISGIGTLKSNDLSLKVNWEFCLDISGQSHLILSYTGIPFKLAEAGKLINFSLDGISIDKVWNITTNVVFVGSRFHTSDGLQNTLYCKSNEVIFSKEKNDNRITSISAKVTNFDFLGLDYSEVRDQIFRDKFSVTTSNRDIEFKLVDNYPEIKRLLEINRINYAILSKFKLEMQPDETIEMVNKEIYSITRFLSLLSLNTNYAQLIEYYDRNEMVRFTIIDSLKTNYHQNVLIDNHSVNAGILIAFNQSFEKFKELEEPLQLNGFVNRIVEMGAQRFIDNKFAHLIMTYESLITNFLIYQGNDKAEIEDMNIQQKLGRINRELRFIPKHLLGENLRELRNPLFHTGTIPFMTVQELYTVFSDYNDLLMRIILRIISYDGNYISRINFRPSKV
jgi:hypothetical protein